MRNTPDDCGETAHARAFPLTPEHATEAELSGLFRLLEQPGGLDDSNWARDGAIAGQAHERR